MCIGIEYFRDGERVTVYFDSQAPELPILIRGGSIGFTRWGTRGAQYFHEDTLAGYARKFPVGCGASLESIRAGKWATFEPRPVRILAARFIHFGIGTAMAVWRSGLTNAWADVKRLCP